MRNRLIWKLEKEEPVSEWITTFDTIIFRIGKSISLGGIVNFLMSLA